MKRLSSKVEMRKNCRSVTFLYSHDILFIPHTHCTCLIHQSLQCHLFQQDSQYHTKCLYHMPPSFPPSPFLRDSCHLHLVRHRAPPRPLGASYHWLGAVAVWISRLCIRAPPSNAVYAADAARPMPMPWVPPMSDVAGTADSSVG